MGKPPKDGGREGAVTIVSVHLGTDERVALQAIFPKATDVDQAATAIAELAFHEWLGWLSGTDRHTTLVHETVERIVSLFAEVMPGKEPSVGFLYNRLNIPYGRARYICQVIAERQSRDLNALALRRLIETLEAEVGKLNAMDPEDAKTMESARITVGRREAKILTNVIDDMPGDVKPTDSFAAVRSPLTETRTFTIAPSSLTHVLDSVKSYET